MTHRDHDVGALILALSSLTNVGPIKVKFMLAQAENPREILEWDVARLESVPGVGPDLARHIKNDLDLDYGCKVMSWAEGKGYQIITFADADYPPPLRELYDPPPFLFVYGNLLPDDYRAVAMVGSRHATDYGKTTASRLASELSRHGIRIISGMAVGIDTACHRGALAGGGRTLAVLGSGIDVIYPRENRALYHQIAEHGAVISEFLPGTDPNPGHFPRRNRLIAGLAQAVVVVEAGEKSGALLTADLALSYGRKLFAVPGNVTSTASAGANELLKTGANLLTSVDDIFSVLPELKNDYIAPRKNVAVDLTEGERLILGRLSETPRQFDELVRECDVSVTEATSYLLSLELRGLVRQLAGKRFITV